MKQLIKKIIPGWLFKKYKSWAMKSSKFNNKSPKDVFTEIYNSNYWKSSESISGTGSVASQTKSLIKDLDQLFIDMKITSVLDIPCGDFNWMKKVNYSKINYIGADIVEELIKVNTEKNKDNDNLKFKVLNLINDPLPKSDMIFSRDCLVHLSYEDIFKAITNIKASGCKYLLTTTFTDWHLNFDIATGEWRKINLQDSPFNFPKPILIINENSTEDNGDNKDKSMALWEISKI